MPKIINEYEPTPSIADTFRRLGEEKLRRPKKMRNPYDNGEMAESINRLRPEPPEVGLGKLY